MSAGEDDRLEIAKPGATLNSVQSFEINYKYQNVFDY